MVPALSLHDDKGQADACLESVQSRKDMLPAFHGLYHLPDEQVSFLRTALGAAAVACPQIDVGSGFAAIVKAALGPANMNMTISPYDNDLDFLLGELHRLFASPSGALQPDQS